MQLVLTSAGSGTAGAQGFGLHTIAVGIFFFFFNLKTFSAQMFHPPVLRPVGIFFCISARIVMRNSAFLLIKKQPL